MGRIFDGEKTIDLFRPSTLYYMKRGEEEEGNTRVWHKPRYRKKSATTTREFRSEEEEEDYII